MQLLPKPRPAPRSESTVLIVSNNFYDSAENCLGLDEGNCLTLRLYVFCICYVLIIELLPIIYVYICVYIYIFVIFIL